MAHLFDTNTFLRLAEKHTKHRPIVVDAIRNLRNENEAIFYSPQVLMEFWNVCTRPSDARGGLGLSVEQTERKAELIQKYFTLLHDSAAVFTAWRRLVSDFQVKGVQVHDARLVATMIAYNIPYLVTFNVKDFQRFPMITVINPSDL